MRLILLPDHPGEGSGGAKLVKLDLARLKPAGGDIVVVRSRDRVESAVYDQILLPPRSSLERYKNVLRRRVSAEASPRDLEPYARLPIDEIFCGGVELYRAARHIFPNHHITVRFHNLFGLVQSRRRQRNYPVDPLFSLYLATYPALERTIFRDANVTLIFASEADRDFHALHFPEAAGSVWAVAAVVNPEVMTPKTPRLVHFGGVSVHKASGIRFFITEVFSDLRRLHPDLEFHLHGLGTERMSNPAGGVFGYGRFEGSGIPHGGDGLFVNPDLLGGGIKIKVGDWLEWGVPFISTPFGVDGYRFETSRHRMVEAIEAWPMAIPRYFGDLGLLTT